MSSAVLEKAQTALIAYQTFQLRLATAISLAQLLGPEEIGRSTIGDAVDSVNQSIGFSLDELPKQGTSSILNGLSLLDRIEGLTDRHPLIVFHLRLILGDFSSPIIKRAIQAHPHCEFLYQWYVSAHRSRLGTEPTIRRRYTELFSRSALQRLGERLYFSPLLQISIGHWFHLTNSIRSALVLHGECPPITVFVSEANSGLTLIESVNSSGLAVVNIEPHDSILHYSLSEATFLYNADYYLSGISAHAENCLQKRFASVGAKSKPANQVYFHLRTPSYKNDGHSYHASIRNVDPKSYIGAINHLRDAESLEPVLVTADLEIQEGLPLPILQIGDRESELRQWKMVRDASFSVGTASGLSHLFNLGQGHTLRTNNNGLALDDFFTDRHLIACKRFKIQDPTQIDLSIHHLAYIICLPWEINNGLASFSTINDLSHDELVEATLEYLDIYHGSKSRNTLYSLLQRLGLVALTNCVPNRNIARSTAQDIERALRMSKPL